MTTTTPAAPLQIKHRHTGAVLFERESGMTMRAALEKATAADTNLSGAYLSDADLRGAYLRGADLSDAYLRGADLRGAYLRGADLSDAYLRGADLSDADLSGANLRGAYLRGADLSGADLSGAYLSYADLRGAYLRGAYLRGADLSGADLSGAYLRGADLSGAYLRGEKLVGDRPFLSVGPIGSRSDTLMAFITDSGVMICAGCFFDTRAEFELQLSLTHGDNEHGKEYRAALALIDKHAELWTPKVEAVESVVEVQP
jgi:hypothetical protein